MAENFETLKSELAALQEELGALQSEQELNLKEKILEAKMEELKLEIDELTEKFEAAQTNLWRRFNAIKTKLAIYDRLLQMILKCTEDTHRRWQIELRIMEIESDLAYGDKTNRTDVDHMADFPDVFFDIY